jgi:hypothetical protein
MPIMTGKASIEVKEREKWKILETQYFNSNSVTTRELRVHVFLDPGPDPDPAITKFLDPDPTRARWI